MTTAPSTVPSTDQAQPSSQTAVKVVQREEKPLPRTIYDASGFEVFAKHFLAGFSQALGMILVYLIFVAIAFTLAVKYLMPTIQPYLDLYKQSMQSLQSIQSTFSPLNSLQGATFQEGTTPAGLPASEQGGATGGVTGASTGMGSMTISPEQLQQAQELLQQMQQKGN